MITNTGYCAKFPNTPWHTMAAKNSDNVRCSFTLLYGQMWSRPFDYAKSPTYVLKRMTSRQRRMMGDLDEGYDPTDYFKPKDQIQVIMESLDFECLHV